MRLGDNGYALLKEWQEEQGLPGFLESSVAKGAGTTFRQLMRNAEVRGWSGPRALDENLAWQGGVLARPFSSRNDGSRRITFHSSLIGRPEGRDGGKYSVSWRVPRVATNPGVGCRS